MGIAIGLSSSSSDDGGDGGAEAGGEVDGGRDGPLRQLPAAALEQRLPRPRLFSAVDAIVLIDVLLKNVMDVLGVRIVLIVWVATTVAGESLHHCEAQSRSRKDAS